MKDIRVTVSDEVTINLGNFQNEKPGYSISATLEEGETVEQVKARLKAKVDLWLETEIREIAEGKHKV